MTKELLALLVAGALMVPLATSATGYETAGPRVKETPGFRHCRLRPCRTSTRSRGYAPTSPVAKRWNFRWVQSSIGWDRSCSHRSTHPTRSHRTRTSARSASNNHKSPRFCGLFLLGDPTRTRAERLLPFCYPTPRHALTQARTSKEGEEIQPVFSGISIALSDIGHYGHNRISRPLPCRTRKNPRTAVASQNFAHASIKFLRFWSASPRRYARSTASPTRCASAASAISRGNAVASPAQSRKALRKPCTVTSASARRSTISIPILDRGFPGLRPGNTNSLVHTSDNAWTIARAPCERGTRCSRAPFIREAGTVQIAASRSISFHLAPSTSPDRAAVRIVNSSACAPMPLILRSPSTNAGTSLNGIAL